MTLVLREHTVTGVLQGLRCWNNLLLLPVFAQMVTEIATGRTWETHANLFYCACFFSEWVLGLVLAEDRRAFLKSVGNWADLLSSIPFGYAFQSLRVLRVLRLVKVVRVAVRSRRFKGAGLKMLNAYGLVASITVSGAIAFRIVEPEATKSLTEALWWSMVTLSTVGYGDFVPKTEFGRIVAVGLMVTGIGVFGYTAGFVASLFDDEEEDEILDRVRSMEKKLDVFLESVTR